MDKYAVQTPTQLKAVMTWVEAALNSASLFVGD